MCLLIKSPFLQEPYSLLKPLLFSTYEEFGIPAVNSGPVVGSVELITEVLEDAGFTDVQVEITNAVSQSHLALYIKRMQSNRISPKQCVRGFSGHYGNIQYCTMRWHLESTFV